MRYLTDDEIKSKKPREKKYRIKDGQGLHVIIYPSGKKSWKYRYMIRRPRETAKVEKIYTIGPYPLVSIAEAREVHQALRKRVFLGEDIMNSESKERMIEKAQVIRNKNNDINNIKWSSSFILSAGLVLTAFNIYPFNLYIQILGVVGWMIVGLLTKDKPITFVNTVGFFILLLGIVYSW